MTKKIVISAVTAILVSQALCPSGDPFAVLALGGMGAFLCVVPLSMLSRLAFVRSASKSIHTLVCICGRWR